MGTTRRAPDAHLYPEQIGANVWLERNGQLLARSRQHSHSGERCSCGPPKALSG